MRTDSERSGGQGIETEIEIDLDVGGYVGRSNYVRPAREPPLVDGGPRPGSGRRRTDVLVACSPHATTATGKHCAWMSPTSTRQSARKSYLVAALTRATLPGPLTSYTRDRSAGARRRLPCQWNGFLRIGPTSAREETQPAARRKAPLLSRNGRLQHGRQLVFTYQHRPVPPA